MNSNLLTNANEQKVIQIAQNIELNYHPFERAAMYETLIQPILHTLTVPIQQLYPGLYFLLFHGFVYFDLENLVEHLLLAKIHYSIFIIFPWYVSSFNVLLTVYEHEDSHS
jgi:uncharacterized membrane protein YvlD (DUF360 family)